VSRGARREEGAGEVARVQLEEWRCVPGSRRTKRSRGARGRGSRGCRPGAARGAGAERRGSRRPLQGRWAPTEWRAGARIGRRRAGAKRNSKRVPPSNGGSARRRR